jgi:hypothetical protein
MHVDADDDDNDLYKDDDDLYENEEMNQLYEWAAVGNLRREIQVSGATDARNVIGLQVLKQNVACDGFHISFFFDNHQDK